MVFVTNVLKMKKVNIMNNNKESEFVNNDEKKGTEKNFYDMVNQNSETIQDSIAYPAKQLLDLLLTSNIPSFNSRGDFGIEYFNQ